MPEMDLDSMPRRRNAIEEGLNACAADPGEVRLPCRFYIDAGSDPTFKIPRPRPHTSWPVAKVASGYHNVQNAMAERFVQKAVAWFLPEREVERSGLRQGMSQPPRFCLSNRGSSSKAAKFQRQLLRMLTAARQNILPCCAGIAS